MLVFENQKKSIFNGRDQSPFTHLPCNTKYCYIRKIEDSKVYANSNNIKKKIIENALEDNDHIIQLTKQQWEYYSDSEKYQILYNNFTDHEENNFARYLLKVK